MEGGRDGGRLRERETEGRGCCYWIDWVVRRHAEGKGVVVDVFEAESLCVVVVAAGF